MCHVRLWTVLLAAGFACFCVGCGGNESQDPAKSLTKQADDMVNTMKALATALEAKADAGEINGHVEGLISNYMDVKANQAQAKELIEVYTKRVKPLLKGEAAATVKNKVDTIIKDLGGS